MFWVKRRHGSVKFLGVAGFTALRLRGGKTAKTFSKPFNSRFNQFLINSGFIVGGSRVKNTAFWERENLVFRERILIIKIAGVHFFGEFHDRNTEFLVTIQNSGFDRGRSAVFGQERRVEIKDTFWLKEIEEILFDNNAIGGENTVSGRMLSFKFFNSFEVGFLSSMKNNVAEVLQERQGGVGKGAVAKENNVGTINI